MTDVVRADAHETELLIGMRADDVDRRWTPHRTCWPPVP